MSLPVEALDLFANIRVIAFQIAYHVRRHIQRVACEPEELLPALERAFALKDQLVFLDIHIDPKEHVYPMQVPGGAMNEMFLSKTERT